MDELAIEIIDYQPKYERGWVHCRVLSFLDTQYYNDVYRNKEIYESDSIELLAIEGEKVIGLLDIEIEDKVGSLCSSKEVRSAMLWHIAIHPDHQRKGLGERLLSEACKRLQDLGIQRLEAWTKEDDFVRKWYFKNGFEKFSSYHHVKFKGEFLKVAKDVKGLKVLSGFAHYRDGDLDKIREHAQVIQECIGLEKQITAHA